MRNRHAVPQFDHWLAPRWSRASTAPARPTSTAAAFRIPERVSERLALVFPTASPQLFVHEGARQALERKLKAAYPNGIVLLSITDNRHTIISHSFKNGVLHARIHHMFLDAPARVASALVRYVVHGDRRASQVVGNYIEANGARLARRRPRAIPLEAKGKHHDLVAIFNDLNEKNFDGGCHALVTWGRRSRAKRRQPRRAIKLGSYASLERLIRIHPALDRLWVPRYFVAYVLYHEMLHHMIPAARGRASSKVASSRESARRVLHPPEFLERERC